MPDLLSAQEEIHVGINGEALYRTREMLLEFIVHMFV